MTRLLRSLWFRGLLTTAILAFLISRIDMRATGAALVRVDLRYLLLALALVALDRGAIIARWIILLRTSGQPVPIKSAAWIHLVSSFLGSALPAGIGSDAARAYTLTQRTAQASEAVASIAVDRVLGFSSIAVMGAIGLIVWSTTDPSAPSGVALPVILVTLAVGGFMLWADRAVTVLVPGAWRRTRVGDSLGRLASSVARYRTRPTALLAVFLVSMFVQTLRIVEAYLLGIGVGVDVEFAYYLVFMPIGLLALLLPISVGGFGLPQGVIVWLLRPRGVPDPLSFALSTLIVLTGLAGALPGAILYARAKNT